MMMKIILAISFNMFISHITPIREIVDTKFTKNIKSKYNFVFFVPLCL